MIINNGLGCGGIQKASSSMANSFSDRGYDVVVVSLYKQDVFFNINSNINFEEPNFNRSCRYLYVFKLIYFIRKTVIKYKPDTILAYGEWTNSFVVLATIFLGIPIYLSDRMSPQLNLGKFQFVLKKIFYRLASGVIVQTELSKKNMRNYVPESKIAVIPNPVTPINKMSIDSQNVIVSVGRLSKEKGFNYLIEAFSRLNGNHWNLIIVGDGDEKNNLLSLVGKLDLCDRVKFVGAQSDLSYFLSVSKIFVLPSLSEGFPNALLEAMSVPLPCISSDCVAGPSDIIDNGVNGLLVEPGDASSLYEALNKLISDDKLRRYLSHNAFYVREKYNLSTISKSYLNFILKN